MPINDAILSKVLTATVMVTGYVCHAIVMVKIIEAKKENKERISPWFALL